MAKDDGAGAGSILLAFLLGAVSGAAVALLYARGPGGAPRSSVGAPARQGRERAMEAAQRGRDVMSQGRETLTSAIERGKEAYQQARTREKA
jgi:hypothetical protein